jgi:hypothetical protein
LGVTAAPMMANVILNMQRRGQNGHLGEPERQRGHLRGRG